MEIRIVQLLGVAIPLPPRGSKARILLEEEEEEETKEKKEQYQQCRMQCCKCVMSVVEKWAVFEVVRPE